MLKVSDHGDITAIANVQEEKLLVEWFEVQKQRLERCTDAGTELQLRRVRQPYLRDGQIIYQDEERRIRIGIKPCDCIVLTTDDVAMVGEFCYDVGNRHLPLFVIEGKGMAVAYDGRLYSALVHKYAGHVRLQSLQLLPQQALSKFS